MDFLNSDLREKRSLSDCLQYNLESVCSVHHMLGKQLEEILSRFHITIPTVLSLQSDFCT